MPPPLPFTKMSCRTTPLANRDNAIPANLDISKTHAEKEGEEETCTQIHEYTCHYSALRDYSENETKSSFLLMLSHMLTEGPSTVVQSGVAVAGQPHI